MLKILDGLTRKIDRFRCAGEAVYLHCPNGYHETKLGNNVLEKDAQGGNDDAKLEDREPVVRDDARKNDKREPCHLSEASICWQMARSRRSPRSLTALKRDFTTKCRDAGRDHSTA